MRGLTSTTKVDWHLKIKDIEYDVGLTKNYCIIVSIQKISSIHTLILKIQQILGSHELNKWPHLFLTMLSQKSAEKLLASLNWTSTQKISSFHQFIPESCDQIGHTHFWPHPPKKIFLSNNLCESSSISKKSGYFTDLDFWNTENNIHFHYYLVKMNDQIFQKIQKKPVFGTFLVHFPNFWEKKFFSRKSSSVTHNFIYVSGIMPKFRKN